MQLWLVIDWPQGQEQAYHYYLAHLHRPPQRGPCLKMSRSRWQIEQYYQRRKESWVWTTLKVAPGAEIASVPVERSTGQTLSQR